MLPYVLYTKETEEYKEYIKPLQFTHLTELFHKDIDGLINGFLYDFSNYSADSLMTSPTKFLLTLEEALHKNLNDDTMKTLIYKWPPLIQINSQLGKEIFYFIVKLLSVSNDKTKIYTLIINALFSKYFDLSNKLNESEIIAFSNGQLVSNNTPCWIYIEKDHTFYAYIENEGQFQPAAKGSIDRITVNFDDNKVILHNEGKIIFEFIPGNQELLTMWCDVLEEDLSLISFFEMKNCSSIDNYTLYPSLLQHEFLNMILNPDSRLLRCLFYLQQIQEIDDYSSLLSSLHHIFANEKKLNLLYSETVMYDLEKIISGDSSINSLSFLTQKDSITSHMMNYLVSLHGLQYYTKFIIKLFKYIDSHGTNISMNTAGHKKADFDSETTKIVFFSSLKYILSSGSFFPEELSNFLSFIRLYSSLFFNEKITIFNLIATFFFQYIIYPAFHSKKPFTTSKLINSKRVKEVLDSIYIVFKHGILPKFDDWEERIRFKSHQQIDCFLSFISEPRIQTTEDLEPIQSNAISEAISICIDQIVSNFEEFESEFSRLEKRSSHGTSLSWNFSVALSMMFPHASDRSELDLNADEMIFQYKNGQTSNKGNSIASSSETRKKGITPQISDLLPPIGYSSKHFITPEGGLKPNLIHFQDDDPFNKQISDEEEKSIETVVPTIAPSPLFAAPSVEVPSSPLNVSPLVLGLYEKSDEEKSQKKRKSKGKKARKLSKKSSEASETDKDSNGSSHSSKHKKKGKSSKKKENNQETEVPKEEKKRDKKKSSSTKDPKEKDDISVPRKRKKSSKKNPPSSSLLEPKLMILNDQMSLKDLGKSSSSKKKVSKRNVSI